MGYPEGFMAMLDPSVAAVDRADDDSDAKSDAGPVVSSSEVTFPYIDGGVFSRK